jgi:hypothetical protein
MPGRALRLSLLALDLLVAVSAGAGGVLVATGLDKFPPEWLARSPFGDYALPGLILAVFVGGSAALAALATVMRPRLGGPASTVAGAVMTGWIAGELLLLSQNGAETSPRSPVEAIYLVVGVAMLVLGAVAWRQSRARG